MVGGSTLAGKLTDQGRPWLRTRETGHTLSCAPAAPGWGGVWAVEEALAGCAGRAVSRADGDLTFACVAGQLPRRAAGRLLPSLHSQGTVLPPGLR